MPRRTVHHGDALAWLDAHGPVQGASFVTSLPDVSGLPGLSLAQWTAWFEDAAARVLDATPDAGVTVFYQTDIKRQGRWIDKGYLCHRAAERTGHALLWHKIVCRKPPGTTSFGRPGYGHLCCYGKRVRDDVARSTPDVLPETGEMVWSRATGSAACEAACRYILRHTSTRTVVDPFCGYGTVLAVANGLGLDAVGVERSGRRVRRARRLRLDRSGCP